jgi:hypothetical protein
LAAASTAFVIWGMLPLYLKQLESVKKRLSKLIIAPECFWLNSNKGTKTLTGLSQPYALEELSAILELPKLALV